MSGWDAVPDVSTKAEPKANGWDAVTDSAPPEPLWEPTPYGFKVKPGQAPTGGPATIREDGAINFPGQGNWLFFDPQTQRYAPAPSEPWANKNVASQALGADTLAHYGRNLKAGWDSAMGGLYDLGSRAATAAGLQSEGSRMDAVRRINEGLRQKQALRNTGGSTATTAQFTGEGIPLALASTAGAPAIGAALPAVAARTAAPLALGAATAAMTPGTIQERAQAGELAATLAPVVELGINKVVAPSVKAVWDGGKRVVQKMLPGESPAVAQASTDATLPAAMPISGPSLAEPAQAAAAESVTPEAVGKVARKASRKMWSKSAKTELAEMAQFNPEAKAQAERLGMELPADVLSDNPQVRAAAGLTRSVAGSEPEAAWRQTLTKAIDKADELMQAHDAHFAAGTTSPGTVSEKVNKALLAERDNLAKQTSEAYLAVDRAIPKETPVSLDRLNTTLAEIEREVGKSGMSKQEARLLAMLEQEPTYGRLIREKNLIGQAIGGQKSPYGDMEIGALKRLYGAMAEDQLANVGNIAGPEVRSQLHGANLLLAKQKGLESRIVGSFGNTMDGSIAGQMRNAILQGSKGDTKDFMKLIKTVPEDLHKETLITALADATRSKNAMSRGGFGFAEFAKTWQGIRANPMVYSRMEKALGPETVHALNDLQAISQRITEARANVLTTGKANQALVGAMTKKTVFENLLDSTASKVATTAAGAAGGGPMGAAATSLLHQMVSRGEREPLRAIGNLFNSTEFMALVEKTASGGKPSGAMVEAVVSSPKFKALAAHVPDMPPGLRERSAWLLSRIAAAGSAPNVTPLNPMPSAKSSGVSIPITIPQTEPK